MTRAAASTCTSTAPFAAGPTPDAAARAADGAAALQAAATQAVPLLRALANPERLVLMCALAQGERCVGDLAACTGIHQPTLSQQLGVLRDEGLVATRRDGKFVHYRVDSPAALALMGVLHELFCPQPAAAGPAPAPTPRRPRPRSS